MNTHQPQNREKRPGDLRQDTNRTAQNNYQEEVEAMHQSTATPTTADTEGTLRAQFDLPGGQATFVMQPLLPEQPGTMALSAITGADDRMRLQMTTEQARDLADWMYCTADEVDAEQEAREAACRTPEQVDLGGPTLSQIGEVLSRQQGTLMMSDLYILAIALGVQPSDLVEAMLGRGGEKGVDDE